jgi:tRNA(Ile)-lysidine synthase
MRYAFLQRAARAAEADAVATAHNADDNVETVLLHLVRGTGLDGLTGIPPRRGNLVRPLLSASRADIDAYLARKGVPWVEDSSNARTEFARNRIRQEVLPVLRSLNPGLSATLAANLVHLRADRDYLYELAAPAAARAVFEKDRVSLPAALLAELPRPVAVRAVKTLLTGLDRYQIAAVHLDRILDLAAGADPGGRLSLPDGLTARREYDRLILSLGEPPEPVLWPAVTLTGPGTVGLETGWTVTLTETVSDGEQGPWRCCLAPVPFPLTLRPRQAGDRLTLPGRRSKTLKKWYIDERIPRRLRDALPVLADENGLLAAAGLGPQAGRTAETGMPALAAAFRPPEGEGF